MTTFPLPRTARGGWGLPRAPERHLTCGEANATRPDIAPRAAPWRRSNVREELTDPLRVDGSSQTLTFTEPLG